MTALFAMLRNPWLLLLVTSLVGAGGTAWYRMQWLGEIAARSQDVAIAEEKVRQAMEADEKRTRELSDQLAAEIAARKDQADARTLAIARSPVTDTCVTSPAMRALFDGLRNRPDQASAVRSSDPKRAGPALSR